MSEQISEQRGYGLVTKGLSSSQISELCAYYAFELVDVVSAELPVQGFLLVEQNKLCYFQYGLTQKPFALDFTKGKIGYRQQHQGKGKQPLAKACGIKHQLRPTIIDATAGFLSDALVLAQLGSHVLAIEQNPLVYLLVDDALRRARAEVITAESDQSSLFERIELHFGNSLQLLINPEQSSLASSKFLADAEVLYLDPMFPLEQKRAHKKHLADVKLPMQILRAFETKILKEQRYAQFVETQQLVKRVVVKRPNWAKPLADKSPSYHVPSKLHRYDVY